MEQLVKKVIEPYPTKTCSKCWSEFLPEDVAGATCLNCGCEEFEDTLSTAYWRRLKSGGSITEEVYVPAV